MERPETVAVIGLGIVGIASLKNLLEEGFDATGFDENENFGGLWNFSEGDKTSVLETTIVNISIERGCFTDFPFPDGTPHHPPAAKILEYVESYADHFNLRPHMRLRTPVKRVMMDDESGKWRVEIDGGKDEYFDKVVFATGSHRRAIVPEIEGREVFEGEFLHSRAFKRPSLFSGKTVVVVGLGSTAADTATELTQFAKQVYVTANRGAYILPRILDGRPMDHAVSQRTMALQNFLYRFLPKLSEIFFNNLVKSIQNKAFTMRPEWNLGSPPTLKRIVPIVSDNLVSSLENGSVVMKPGIQRFTGPRQVQFTNGETLEVDAVVFCTGYSADFSLIDPRYNPLPSEPTQWSSLPGSRTRPFPRLYRNILSLSAPQSLAFPGNVMYTASIFPIADLSSMAITQIWRGKSRLPPQEEMEAEARDREESMTRLARDGTVTPAMVDAGWEVWAHGMAGTGVDEYLGWGWAGWWFWLRDWRFCSLMMGGVATPFIYRYFETGKRRSWAGAREAIKKVNMSLRKDKQI